MSEQQQTFSVHVQYSDPPREGRGPTRIDHDFVTEGDRTDTVRDIVLKRAEQAGLVVDKLVVTPIERAD